MKTIFGAAMVFGWNAEKAASNLEKHGVQFEQADEFDFDGCVTSEDNRFDYEEDRYVALGSIGGRIHVLVFTLRNMNREPGVLWIISLRKANKREIRAYEQEKD